LQVSYVTDDIEKELHNKNKTNEIRPQLEVNFDKFDEFKIYYKLFKIFQIINNNFFILLFFTECYLK